MVFPSSADPTRNHPYNKTNKKNNPPNVVEKKKDT